MSLNDNVVRATAAVSDIDRAVDFYENKLGLAPMEGGPDMIRIYECGEKSLLQVYQSDHAGENAGTVASFSITSGDYGELIDELIEKGVEFERYGEHETDEKGVHTFGDHQVAWCRDPDGNTIAIDNGEGG